MKNNHLHILQVHLFPTISVFILSILISSALPANAKHNSAVRINVSGTVTSKADGTPLPGVTVVVKGSTIGTSTDKNGRYQLSVPDAEDTLVFSFLGYATQSIPVNGRNQIDVVMSSKIFQAQELVVIGYGSEKKENLTSAITHVTSEDFTKGTVQSPLQLLAGKVAGLAFSNPNGDPTRGVQINIRGVSTLASSSDPLIVIDGVPGGSLNAIAPEDIKSIDILKGGSAAAIYGSRANGGVIIITTKKGRGNDLSIEYDGSVSFDHVENKIDVLSAYQYRHLSDLTGIKNLNISDQGHSTNWQNQVLRSPVNQVQHLSLYGGGDHSNYTASFTYRSDDGIMLNSDKESLISRLTMNRSALNDRLRFSIEVSDNLTNQKEIWYNAYLTSLIKNPTDSVYLPDGSYTDFPAQPLNPVAQLKTETAENRWNQLLINGKITVEPIKNWDISVLGAYQRYDNDLAKSNNFQNQSTTLLRLNGQVWLNGEQSWDKTIEVTTSYTGSMKNHHYTILGGYSYQYFNNQGYNMYAYDFPTDRFGPWNIGAAQSIVEGDATLGSFRETHKLTAFFGRINYDYKGKYLLMASLRREGSTKFGANHKWGWFPAASVGWRISDEAFMQNINFIDNLKLRAGYGITGTQPNANYLSLSLLQYTNRAFVNGEWLQGVKPSSNPNPDLRWEKKQELDIGLDFTLFKNLNGSIDYYNRKTKDLLYLYNVPVPPNLYNQTWANVGDIENEGLEIALNAIPVSHENFTWSIGGTYSYNTNKLLKFSNDTYQLDFINAGWTGSPIQQYTHRVEEGQPIGNFFGWKSVGLDENGNWLIETNKGKTIPVSEAGDGDKQILGNGIPKMYASLFTSVRYRNFDLSFTLRGAFKYQILNQFRMQYETLSVVGNANVPVSIFNKPYNSDLYIQGAPQYVSYYIEDGDYVKLSNAQIGYNVPLGNQSAIQKLRFYIAGINLYTFTGYSGLDPEATIKGLDPGMDYMEKYPPIRRITVGVQLSLK